MNKTSIGVSLLVMASSVFSADADKKIMLKVQELSLKPIPKEKALGEYAGTTLKVAVTYEGKELIGLDVEKSNVSFRDDTGRDLFALGAAQKETWKIRQLRQNSFSIPIRDRKENMLSEYDQKPRGKEGESNGGVVFRCHAFALPSQEAKAVIVKGELVLLAKAKARKEVEMTVGDFLGKKSVTIGNHNVVLKEEGTWRMKSGGRVLDIVKYSCHSNIEILDVRLAKKTKEINTTVFHIDADSGKPNVSFFRSNLKASDKLRVEYLVPERINVDIDLNVPPHSSRSSKKQR